MNNHPDDDRTVWRVTVADLADLLGREPDAETIERFGTAIGFSSVPEALQTIADQMVTR